MNKVVRLADERSRKKKPKRSFLDPGQQEEVLPGTLVGLEEKAQKRLDEAKQDFAGCEQQINQLLNVLAKQIRAEWKINLKFVCEKYNPPELDYGTGAIDNNFLAYYNVKRGGNIVGKVTVVRKLGSTIWEVNLHKPSESHGTLNVETEWGSLYEKLTHMLARAKVAGRLEFLGLKPQMATPS